MRVAFIGDIVGRVGRDLLKSKLSTLKEQYNIDYTIANGENASGGFGISLKNANELIGYGVDVITGGNHSLSHTKELNAIYENKNILRPHNYPKQVAGSGVFIDECNGVKVATISLMGQFTMPSVDNPFNMALEIVDELKNKNIKHIFIDFHAQATAEKATLFAMLKSKVSVIVGTHTHIATDDLKIDCNTCFVSDIGLSGCRDGVIGMDVNAPIKRATTAMGYSLYVPKKCKSIFQMIVCDIDDNGYCANAFRLKLYSSDNEHYITKAYKEL